MGTSYVYPWVILIFFTFFASDFSLKHKFTPCTKLGYDSCKCTFPDGQGLDLNLPKTTDFGWVTCQNSANHSVHFNPCFSPFNNTNSTCFKSLACLRINSSLDVNLGKRADSNLVMDSISRQPYMEFKLNKSLTTVELKCDPKLEEAELECVAAENTTYLLRLRGKEACIRDHVKMTSGGGGGNKGDHSTLGVFSVLLIIATVLLLAYFIGGFLVLRFIKGARGIETIPNHEFWLHLPTHAKNGVLFLLNGCKNPVTYESI